MENNKKDKQKHRLGYGSIDGFRLAQPKPRKTAFLPRVSDQDLIAKNASSKPSYKATGQKLVKPVSNSQPSPFLGTTISSYKSVSFNKNGTKSKIKPKKTLKQKIIKRSVITMAALLIGVGVFVGMRGLSTIDKVFHGNVLSDVTAAFNDKPLKGENGGRVNILLAGDSADQAGHGGANLTDSILLLSIDTKNHTAFMLSIPRDLWVNIPGVGYQKINAANDDLGKNFPGYPQNGMGQLEHIVTADLGIPIDYYGLSDYGAFQDAVNAVGGVTINIQSPDPRGLYDSNTKIDLPNGPAVLNGLEALNLARARGDGYKSYGFPDSDFDRTEHQRQIFTAVIQKAETIGVLSNPVKISDLFNAFGNNVQTNLSLQNVLRLAQITKGLNLSNIKSFSYCSTLTVGEDGCTNPILTDYTDPDSGESALAPLAGLSDYEQMEEYYQHLTSDNPIIKEAASVVVLNASDVDGLAKGQQSSLEAKGVNVATIADANNEYPSTMIVDNSKGTKPDTLKLLQQKYPGTTVTSDTGSAESGEAQAYTSDFVVIIGQNWDSSSSNQLP
jgi:LCP family protein required for cell wall assembly